jgi:DNA adenine methylase
MGCQRVELLNMEENNFRPVTPIRPAAAYIGGKRRLGEQLARRIEAVEHATYAEPFVGMGGVFFRRRWAPRREVINDISRDVATLFRILQRHYPQFMETLKFQIASRREFERLLACNPDTLTDLERAGRFLYLQRLAFGGNPTESKTASASTQKQKPNLGAFIEFRLAFSRPTTLDYHSMW